MHLKEQWWLAVPLLIRDFWRRNDEIERFQQSGRNTFAFRLSKKSRMPWNWPRIIRWPTSSKDQGVWDLQRLSWFHFSPVSHNCKTSIWFIRCRACRVLKMLWSNETADNICQGAYIHDPHESRMHAWDGRKRRKSISYWLCPLVSGGYASCSLLSMRDWMLTRKYLSLRSLLLLFKPLDFCLVVVFILFVLAVAYAINRIKTPILMLAFAIVFQ